MTPQEEAAEQYANKVVGEYSSNDDEYFKWNTAREDFLAGQKWQSEQDIYSWIKSSDQLPPYNKGVLVFIPEEDNHITAGMYDISNKWILLDDYRQPQSQVTYWREMPPEPEDKSYEKSFVHTDDLETMPGIIRTLNKKLFDSDQALSSALKEVAELNAKVKLLEIDLYHAECNLDISNRRVKELESKPNNFM